MYRLCLHSLRGSTINLAYFRRLDNRVSYRLVHTADNAATGSSEKAVPKCSNSSIPASFANAKMQLLSSLKEVQLSELQFAPRAVFWSGVAGLIPIVLPPFVFFITGYSNALATCQMTFAATISAFLSGTRYGTHVSDKESATWPEICTSILPQFMAFSALLMPQIIGFPLITLSLMAIGFLDVTSHRYPSWFRAMRIGLTAPVVVSLLITCIFKMFN